jgi:hypothetical protein
MKKFGFAALAAALLSLSAPMAQAHHSAAMFDFAKTNQVTGVVKHFELINPHMRLTLVLTDAKGTRDVDFEGHSLNNMYRAGWRPNMIKEGDKITVIIAPRKDGLDGGYVTSAIVADGRHFGMRSSAEIAKAAAETH